MSCGLTRASGIRPGFPGLSQTWGQVAHVLLTRSPLALHRCCHRMVPARLACIKHAASVRPEPGSNSPSKSCRPGSPGGRSVKSRPSPVPKWHRTGRLAETFVVVRLRYEMTIRRPTASGGAGSPALTFEPSVPFSRCNQRGEGRGTEPGGRSSLAGTARHGRAAGVPTGANWPKPGLHLPEGRTIKIPTAPHGVKPHRVQRRRPRGDSRGRRPGRKAETHGESGIHHRHGSPTALLIPTRGPTPGATGGGVPSSNTATAPTG